MKKAFYFDVETTGLEKEQHALVQLACIVEYGNTTDSLVLDIDPTTYNKSITISAQALEVTGKTLETLWAYPTSKEQFEKFINFLDKHINKFDKTDKFYPIGFNSSFDMGFLIEWFADNDHKYFGSYFHYKDIDVYKLYSLLLYELDMPQTENHKLGTLCAYYGIQLENAHDALADIRATKELYSFLKQGLNLDTNSKFFLNYKK